MKVHIPTLTQILVFDVFLGGKVSQSQKKENKFYVFSNVFKITSYT